MFSIFLFLLWKKKNTPGNKPCPRIPAGQYMWWSSLLGPGRSRPPDQWTVWNAPSSAAWPGRWLYVCHLSLNTQKRTVSFYIWAALCYWASFTGHISVYACESWSETGDGVMWLNLHQIDINGHRTHSLLGWIHPPLYTPSGHIELWVALSH